MVEPVNNNNGNLSSPTTATVKVENKKGNRRKSIGSA